ncbi:MAG: exodeoxyribonuclease V subunit gamma, partial [Deltaproteobacteria bacterium]|nr:exodeoxyribonuclease V subunit gamma [Deltaproteobacteria bacterium]
MLRVTHSNWTEALLASLGRRLPRDAFVEATVIVPNRAMERVVELGLARAHGLVANVRFARLEAWMHETLVSAEPVLSRAELEGRVLAVLSDPSIEGAREADPATVEGELGPVVRYLLAGDGRWTSGATDRRRLELAPRLAQLFSEYTYSRPDWIRAWMRGEVSTEERGLERAVERWQAALYRRARGIGPARTTLAELLEAPPRGLPKRTHEVRVDGGPAFVFGVSYVARVFHDALVRIGEARDVELFVLNPCRELWSDVASRGAGRERVITESVSGLRAPSLDVEEDEPESSPFLASVESPLLEAWGRPGREHVATLDAAVEFDTTARFVDPGRGEDTHLHRVQRSLLDRTPIAPGPTDGSLVVLPCTSVRREVETVVSLVWALLADTDRLAREGHGEPLRSNEIAILVPASDRETYLPHLEVVLEGARGDGVAGEGVSLPWSAQDLRLAARSRVAEAGLRLLSFLGATPTRRAVLGLVAHPLVRSSASEIEPPGERFWAELADEVGIVRGIDERDLRGTYADRASGEGRVLHFDQGLARLAIGCALGEGSEETTVGELAPARVSDTESVMAFVTLVRSLLADHRALEGARLTLTAWASLFDALLGAYVRPSSSGSTAEDKELESCRKALREIASMDVIDADEGAEPRLVSKEIALGLATRALEDVPAVRGEPQSMGVVVASLLPMRAIPFRVVFVLGLGEGLFPEEGMDLGLDLRRARRRVGDVAPEERDRYAFLETLVSTRDRLFLSYVARDEHTGDPHAPSTVLTELLEAAGGALEVRPPARRHDALTDRSWLMDGALGLSHPTAFAAMVASMSGAVSESTARQRGDRERHHFQDVEVTTEAWARMSADDPRRVELALPPLPPATLDVERVVRVKTLHAFLACPLQGRASHWLRGAAEDDRALLVDEEPLDAEARDLGSLARDALLTSLDRGLGESPARALAHAVDEVVEAARGRGHVPVGVLGEDVRRAVITRAERWLAALLEARPGVRLAHTVRLGRASAHDAAMHRHVDVRAALLLANAPVPAGASR